MIQSLAHWHKYLIFLSSIRCKGESWIYVCPVIGDYPPFQSILFFNSTSFNSTSFNSTSFNSMSTQFLLKTLSAGLFAHPQRSNRSLTSVLIGTLWLWLSWISPSLAQDIRVAIQQNIETLTVGSSTPAKVVDGLGKEVGQLQELNSFQAAAVPGAVQLGAMRAWQLQIVPEGENGLVYIGDRWYRGTVRLVRTSSGFKAINHVNLEDYLASVLGKEVYTTWPIESLKAQAVASRSYAAYKLKKQKNQPYDLGRTTSSQVYGGIESEAPSTIEAVVATRGQILTYGGNVIEAVFHSSSGGHTENSEQVWQSAVPYLRGVPDFDQEAPVYKWTANFTAAQLRQRLPGVGNIKALTPLQTSPTGRVKTMKIQGDGGSQVISGQQLRKALGLKSTLILSTPQFGLLAGSLQGADPQQFTIQGRGYGHGIGMSQWGAYGLAKQGKTYQEIVQHYYPGTALQTLTP